MAPSVVLMLGPKTGLFKVLDFHTDGCMCSCEYLLVLQQESCEFFKAINHPSLNPHSCCGVNIGRVCVCAGATNHVLTSLVASFDREPSALLTSLVPLPLRSNLRHYALLSLQAAVKVCPTCV